MSVEMLISETAWRLRSLLGSAVDERRATLEQAFSALFQAERIATRYQLPERACHTRCAYVAPWGGHCRARSCTPEIHGFLTINPDNPKVPPNYLECWPFTGRLCVRHLGHLVVPPDAWWPEESANGEREVAQL